MDPLRILTGFRTFKSILPCNLSACTKQQILEYFENSYSLNESIFSILACKEAFYMCPDRLRLPLIFYYAHTAVVYVNKFLLAGLIKERVNFEYETMFETGVDEMNWDDVDNYRMGAEYKWPPLDKVVEFRAQVRQIIRRVIQETPLELPVTKDSPWWAVFMGMDHERIHVETSSVLIRQLPLYAVRRPPGWTIAPKSHGDGVKKNPLIMVEQKDVSVGKPDDYPTYGWDNEYPQSTRRVPAFEASTYLITNKQFLHFVNHGGYTQKEWWSEEGWAWCDFRKPRHPIFWICNKGCLSNNGASLARYSHCEPYNNNEDDGKYDDTNNTDSTIRCNIAQNDNRSKVQIHEEYRLRTTCTEIDMPWDWPVVITYHEAKAYCNWLGDGYRLLTEAEHNAIRNPQLSSSDSASADFSWSPQLDKKYNLNLHYGSSTPVNMYPPTESGFHDVFGNVWEWTEDHFNGLPDFKTHALYDDFSTPTFDGRHNVIMGGSWVSSGTQACRFGRYSFRRHFFQHAGFRIARTVNAPENLPVRLVLDVNNTDQVQPTNLNITILPSTNTQLQEEKTEYLGIQLQKEYDAESTFAQVVSAACLEAMNGHGASFNKALDLGCGCGRLTFELSNHFKQVLGSDFCEQYIASANQLKEDGSVSYHVPDISEGPVAKRSKIGQDAEKRHIRVPDKCDSAKVDFKQFTWIPNELADFDLVVHHYLDRVQNKKAWLLRIGEIIVPRGLVIIACTEDWTDRAILPAVSNWLKLLDTKEILFREEDQEKSAVLTIWQRE